MIPTTENKDHFLHETSQAERGNLEQAMIDRFWWASRYSDRLVRAENLPPTEIILQELNSRLLLAGELDSPLWREPQSPGKYRTGNVTLKTANVAFLDYKFVPDMMASFGSIMDRKVVEMDKQQENGTLMVKDIIENRFVD